MISEKLVSTLRSDPELLKRFKEVTINRGYRIPYIAGSSLNHKTVYIDSKLPLKLPDGEDYLPFLLIHEIVEKYLIDVYGKKYEPAHLVASAMEKRAALKSGIDWKVYTDFFNKWAKRDEQLGSEDLPPDLDLTPYYDDHDEKVIKGGKK